jgi:hypothetical protein
MTNSTLFKFLIKSSTLLISLGLIYTMYASSNGSQTGKSESTSSGCNCHGSANSDTKVTATVSGGLTFEPGEEKTITINVQNSGQSGAGINASVKTKETGGSNAGTLSAGTGTKVQSNEITHTSTKDFTGDNTDFTFDWTAPNEPGEYYILAVGNAVNKNFGTSGDEFDWMDPVKVTVQGLNLTALNGGQDICTGSTVNITWDGFGVNNVKIELSSDGGSNYTEILIASTSGTSWEWNVPNSLDAGSEYRIRISDASNANISSESTSNFSVSSGVSISNQPEASQTICSGEALELEVTASGANLSYQWKKDGNNINGATASTLLITNAQTADAGTYICEINSDCGSATTDEALVTINQSPLISSFPLNASECEGNTLSLEVEASGSGLTYQWKKDGNDISGATSSILEISDVQASDAGDYSVIVTSDNCGSIESDEATVTILTEPEITTQTMVSNSKCEDSEVKVWVNASGNNISYKWQKNKEDIAGTNSKTLTLSNYSQSDFGNYRCVISNNCGSVNSDEISINEIDPLPEITSSPSSRTASTGSNFSISVSSVGDDLNYQWFKNGNQISNESGPELQFLNASLEDNGQYYCMITNDCGSVESEIAQITIVEEGLGPVLSTDLDLIDFGNIEVGEVQKTLFEDFFTNNGDQPLFIAEVELTDQLGGIFALTEFNSTTVQPGNSRDLLLSFGPNAVGSFSTTLTVTTGHGDNRSILVTGNGVEASVPVVTSSLNSKDFGDLEIGKEIAQEITLSNTDEDKSVTLNSISFKNNSTNFVLGNKADIQDPVTIQSLTDYNFEIIFKPDGETTGEIMEKLVIDFEVAEDIEIDLSGNILEPKSIKEAASFMNAYPIPANNKINFDLETTYHGKYSISIANNYGEIIKDLGNIYATNNRLNLEWNGLTDSGLQASSGVYYLIVEGNDSFSKIKFVINK